MLRPGLLSKWRRLGLCLCLHLRRLQLLQVLHLRKLQRGQGRWLLRLRLPCRPARCLP